MRDISIDLFSTELKKVELHPNFKVLIEDEIPFLRREIEKWATGFLDRDNKFIREFQTTFNSSFWELYLFAVFKELGLKVNFSYDRPDFNIEGENDFCIEATVALNANGMTPEWERKYSKEEIEEWLEGKIEENATIRLANAFVGKSKKYESYNKLEHVKDKPFLIAIAPFDSPYFFTQNTQPIFRVLYGFDRYIAIDWDEYDREIIDGVLIEEIEKSNGAKIPLGYFTKPDYSHVSAVIFSKTATVGKARILSDDPRVTVVSYDKYNDFGTQPISGLAEKTTYQEDLTDGLMIFHNPYAKNPIAKEVFKDKNIAQYTYNIKTGEVIGEVPHQFLFNRSVIVYQTERYSKNQLRKFRESIIRQIRLGEFESEQVFPKFHS
ncbi:hypothetical protein [Planococcus sp. SSTMD024]|uniref:hypothetical protein n=1 Tax=Planococcus sp. SSTMD024 TaxID=3242163 RepID=UPI00351EC113